MQGVTTNIVTGKILKIEDTKTSGQDGQYQDRKLHIDCTSEHEGVVLPNKLIINFQQANTGALDAFKEGDNVVVKCKPVGRYYEKEVVGAPSEIMHFQMLAAWSIELVKQEATPEATS